MIIAKTYPDTPHREVTTADVAMLVIEQAINGLRQGRSGHSATPAGDADIMAALEAGLDALAGLAGSSPMLAHERDEHGKAIIGRAFARAALVAGSEERARYLAEGVATASRRRYEAARRAERGGNGHG